MKLLLLTLFTIVILDPYRGLDYDEPNLYFIDEENTQEGPVETLSHGYSEKDPPRDEKEEHKQLVDYVRRKYFNPYFGVQ